MSETATVTEQDPNAAAPAPIADPATHDATATPNEPSGDVSSSTDQATDPSPGADGDQGDDDGPVMWGFSEREGRRLLENAAQFEQLRDALNTHVRNMDSKYGGLMSKLNQKPEDIELSEDDFKELLEEYGDDRLVKGLVNGLKGKLKAYRQDPEVLNAAIEERVTAILSTREKDIEERAVARVLRMRQEEILDEKHEGWKEKADSREMALWESLQAPEALAKLDEDFKTKPFATVMLDVLDRFDRWAAARKRRAADNKELRESVTPRGAGGRSEAISLADAAEQAAQKIRERGM